MLTHMDTATLVRNTRTASAKTHRSLASDALIAASTITRIESRRAGATVDMVEKILDACGYELELRAVRKDTPPQQRLDDLIDAWEPGPTSETRLAWTRWRAWLDGLAQHPTRIPEAIYITPAPSGNAIIDTLLAAIAEKLADDAGLPRPSWTSVVPAADPAYEPPARRRGQICEQFSQRGLLIDDESLFRPMDTVGA